MKKIILGIVLGLIVGAGVTWILRSHAAAEPPAAEVAAKPEESPLHYTAEQRKTAGIELADPTPVVVQPELTVYGRVLDTSALLTNAVEVTTLQMTLSLAEKDLSRIKSLYENGGNASLQALQASESTEANIKVQLDAARIRFALAWGPTLAEKATGEWLQQVTQKGWTLARLDFFPGQAPGKINDRIQVSLLTDDAEKFDMQVLGPATTVDPQIQGQGLFVSMEGKTLPTGLAVRAVLPGSGNAEKALLLPSSAIVYHEGSAFIYVMSDKDIFERRLVTLGRSVGDKVSLTSGVEERDHVVVKGSQQLLSGELQAAAGPAPEKD